MFIATSLASLLNYAFNLVMGRMLGPGEYSVMSALLGVYVVISIPVVVVNTVVAKRVSDRLALGKAEEIGEVIWETGRLVVWYAGIVVLFMLVFSPCLARFLRVDRTWPVVATLSIVLPALALYVARGCLQGMQWFSALAANTLLEAVLRLGWGIALVALGCQASGGLLAQTCSSVSALILAGWSLRPFLQRWAAPEQLGGQTRYFVFTLAGYVAFALLTNLDVVLARHFFPPQMAGEYAAVATLGKIVLFFPSSVATVMFPKTALRRARREETTSAVGKSAVATLALCLVPIGGLSIWARPFLHWSYGNAYAGGAGLLGMYGLAMGLYALVSLLLQYFLSVDDLRFIIVLAVAAVLSALGIGLFHTSAVQVVTVVGVVGGLVVVAGALLCVFPVLVEPVA